MPTIPIFTDETTRLGMSCFAFKASPASAIQNSGYNRPFKNVLLLEEVPDTTAPTMSFDPVDGSSIAEDDPVTVHFDDNRELAAVWISASVDGGPNELVWDLSGAGPGYSVSPVGDDVGGYDITFTRDAGWHGDVSINAQALDTSRNHQIDGAGYEAPPAAPLDAGPPTILNFSPAPGSQLQSTDTVSFDVTDDTQLLSVMILARFGFLDAPELVHDGLAFSPAYSVNSTREAIDGGWHYTLLRKSGWPEGPTLLLYVLDAAGNEAAEAVD